MKPNYIIRLLTCYSKIMFQGFDDGHRGKQELSVTISTWGQTGDLCHSRPIKFLARKQGMYQGLHSETFYVIMEFAMSTMIH
jgi:hypothetical protein